MPYEKAIGARSGLLRGSKGYRGAKVEYFYTFY
jgi:hypothetical protein